MSVKMVIMIFHQKKKGERMKGRIRIKEIESQK